MTEDQPKCDQTAVAEELAAALLALTERAFQRCLFPAEVKRAFAALAAYDQAECSHVSCPRHETTDPFDSLRAAIATDPRDWSVNKTDAWLWGVIMGWDEAMPEVGSRHGWTTGDMGRLADLHATFAAVGELARGSDN